MIDVPLAHLDRPFDYEVPGTLDAQARPGVRVRVRFAGKLVDGYLLDRVATTDHAGRLTQLQRVVGEPVLTPETTELLRAVADRWAGSFVDVARLAIPPRHARAEKAGLADTFDLPASPPPVETDTQRASDAWSRYRHGEHLIAALRDGRTARAAWTALPGEDWPLRLAELAGVTLAAGQGALLVVPDQRDLERVDAALTAVLADGPSAIRRHVALSAGLGPAERYKRWLAVRTGQVRCVVGTRGAAYAPVAELGLVVCWDDGDDLHAEPRAPYPHARDVLAMRAAQVDCTAVFGGLTRTSDVAQLVLSGWARDVVADRALVRSAAPRIVVVGDDFEQQRDPAARSARLPTVAHRTARDALAEGRPVLVQVPRRGYVPALACQRDRTPARCAVCNGPLGARASGGAPVCRWCGRPAADWSCPTCGNRTLRAVAVGQVRTAEELGRAFPGATVRTSAGDAVLRDVPPGPALVVATPGAEPLVTGGYGAALLLDGGAMLGRADLRAGEEALRRWFAAAALVASDGVVVVNAPPEHQAVQALVRWDPIGFSERELAERSELGFPPAVRIAAVTGLGNAPFELLDAVELPPGAQVLGPVPAPPGSLAGFATAQRLANQAPKRGELFTADRSADPVAEPQRMLVRVPRSDGAALARALHAGLAGRSARRADPPVQVRIDPLIVL